MKYQLINETDQIPATPSTFSSEEKALAYADKLRQRFIMQGYYLTAAGVRIRPDEVQLKVVPAK